MYQLVLFKQYVSVAINLKKSKMTTYKFSLEQLNLKNVYSPKKSQNQLLECIIRGLDINKKKDISMRPLKMLKYLQYLTHNKSIPDQLKIIGKEYNVNFTYWVYANNKITLKLTSNIYFNECMIHLLKVRSTHYLIKDFDAVTKIFHCPNCTACFVRNNKLQAHKCKTAERERTFKSKPKLYRPKKYLVELIQDIGVPIPDNYKFIKYIGVVDCESYCYKVDKDNCDDIIETQTCALIGFASNFPGYEVATFWNKQLEDCYFIKEFVEYCLELSEKVSTCIFNENKTVIYECLKKVRYSFYRKKYSLTKYIVSLIKKICNYLFQFRIFGYNSGNYDYPLMSTPYAGGGLIHCLANLDSYCSVIRDRGHQKYLCIQSKRLKFLDIIRYLPAGTPLSRALKNFGIEEKSLFDIMANKENINREIIMNSGSKLLYPFSRCSNYEKMISTNEDFQYSDFYSSLNLKCSLSPNYEHYQELLQLMSQENALNVLGLSEPPLDPMKILEAINFVKNSLCTSHADYLAMYCLIDCISTLKLTNVLIDEFYNFGIPYFHESLTISSMAYAYMMKSFAPTKPGPSFFVHLPPEDHQWIRKSLVGGISVALNRLMIVGETPIDFHRVGPEKAHIVKSIKMFDVNSMYMTCLSSIQCSTLGYPIKRHSHDNFKISTIHGRNCDEFDMVNYFTTYLFPAKKCVSEFSPRGQYRLWLDTLGTYTPVDLFVFGENDKNEVVSFHGCHIHICPHCFAGKDLNQVDPIRQNCTLLETKSRSDKIDEAVTNHPKVNKHHIIYQCKWKEFRKIHNEKTTSYYDDTIKNKHKEYSQEEMLTEIVEERMNGFVECSLAVTDEMLPWYSKFPPLYFKKKMSIHDLDLNQRIYALKYGLLNTTEERDVLLLGLSAEDIIITSEMFRFLLKNKIVDVKNIKTVIQFHRDIVFQSWRNHLVAERIKAEKEGKKVKSLLIKLFIIYGIIFKFNDYIFLKNFNSNL